MNYSTVYVRMDVHEESFSLCCYTNEKEQTEFPQRVARHYSKVLNYIEAMRFHYGNKCSLYAVMKQVASGSRYSVNDLLPKNQ